MQTEEKSITKGMTKQQLEKYYTLKNPQSERKIISHIQHLELTETKHPSNLKKTLDYWYQKLNEIKLNNSKKVNHAK